jgi:hypothetical protein
MIATQPAGTAASSASTARKSSAPDITSIATAVAVVVGGAHCQPTASWAHMAVPKVRKTASEQVSVPRLARAPAVPAGGPASPAVVRRAVMPQWATLTVRRQARGCSENSASRSSANSSP